LDSIVLLRETNDNGTVGYSTAETIADARRQIEAWRIHYNTVRPHSSLGNQPPEQFRATGGKGYGKAGHNTRLENSTLKNAASFPLSHSHDGGDNSSLSCRH